MTLTLPRALALADHSHPEIARALAQLEAAGGRALQAGLFPNPVAVARLDSAPLDGRTAEEAEYVAGISQDLPLGSRLSAASRVGRLEEARLQQELAVLQLQIRGRVHGAFATTLYLEQVIEVETRVVTIAEVGLAAAQARLAAGDTLPEDVARAEMELERARLELQRARSLHEEARAELVAAIGNEDAATHPLEGALEATLDLPTLEALCVQLENHPSVAAAEADLSVQRARVDLASAQRIPDVNLDLFYRRLEVSHANAIDIGIAIPLPLFDRSQGGIREAQAATRIAEARARSTHNELHRELRQSHARLVRTLAFARTLGESILPRAKIVLQAFEARYAAGDASLTEVLLVRRELTAAELARLDALRQVMEAWAALSPYLPEL